MPTDNDIARTAKLRPIADVAADLGLEQDQWHAYGHDVAKIDPAILTQPRRSKGRSHLILVSAITPNSRH